MLENLLPAAANGRCTVPWGNSDWNCVEERGACSHCVYISTGKRVLESLGLMGTLELGRHTSAENLVGTGRVITQGQVTGTDGRYKRSVSSTTVSNAAWPEGEQWAPIWYSNLLEIKAAQTCIKLTK